MKKKFALLVTAALIMGLAAGCGSSETKPETAETAETAETEEASETAVSLEGSYLKDFTAADYVTLGEYKGLEITVDPLNEVTEEYRDLYIEYTRNNSAVAREVTDRAVENGDTVTIDYEGKKDGVAFDGGTAQGAQLIIGSGSFIEGFEEGLIGTETGETKDLTLKFPEEYDKNPDLAGQEVVFTVTVNKITVQEIPELNDEYVAGLGIEGVATLDDYKNYVTGELTKEEENVYRQNKENEAAEAAAEASEFKDMPEALVNRYHNALTQNMTVQASYYGVELADFMTYYYGMDEETYLAEFKDNAERSAQQSLMFKAIAEKENLNVSEEELQEKLQEHADGYGYDVKEYTSKIDMEEFREFLMSQKVVSFLVENAVITEAPAQETPETEETEDGAEAPAETETEGTQESEEGTQAAETEDGAKTAETEDGTEAE